MPTPPTEKNQIYSVSALSNTIRQTLIDHYTEIWVEGEIFGLVVAASKHIYFSIKDTHCQIRCAMFRSKSSRLKFKPENGMQVLLYAQPDIYQPRGDLQLIVSHIEMAGAGKLQLEFERLKQKLLAEGLFEPELKKEIPQWPSRVGVISSEKGAAVRDVISVVGKRFPAIELIIYPTLVQGKEAPEAICNSLLLADSRKEVDLLLLVRGGGSIEDLAAFNDEGVARTIVQCQLPIVSGIGHAIDSTIADFVCDKYAPTPSAAAENISPNQHEVNRQLVHFHKHTQQLLYRFFNEEVQRFQMAEIKLSKFHPSNRLLVFIQQLDEIDRRLLSVINNNIATQKEDLYHIQARLKRITPLDWIDESRVELQRVFTKLKTISSSILFEKQNKLDWLNCRLQDLNPLTTLKRGYAIVTDKQNRLLHSVNQAKQRQSIKITMDDGKLSARVEAISKHRRRN